MNSALDRTNWSSLQHAVSSSNHSTCPCLTRNEAKTHALSAPRLRSELGLGVIGRRPNLKNEFAASMRSCACRKVPNGPPNSLDREFSLSKKEASLIGNVPYGPTATRLLSPLDRTNQEAKPLRVDTFVFAKIFLR
jgi:hypothetical protein